ncbi:hypothetical protein ACFUCV_07555 [Specibacter sp. NPDC057265]
MKKSSYPKRSSTLQRVFNAPLDQQKLEQVRVRAQQDLMAINLHTIR